MVSRYILMWPRGMARKRPPAILNSVDEDMVL